MKSNVMKNIFQHISLSRSDYEYMLKYTPAEKFEYLVSTYQLHTDILESNSLHQTLGDFFNEIAKHDTDTSDDEDDVDDTEYDISDIEFKDVPDSKYRVDILLDDDHILVESNSLKALRQIMNKFFDSGYVLQRDLETEKIFRKDKQTRYLRVYNVIGIVTTICPN